MSDILKTHGFSFQMTTQRLTGRGVEWTGQIIHGNAAIGSAYNAGDGGCTVVNIPNAKHHAEYQRVARQACPKSHEPESRFAELLADAADGLIPYEP